MGDAESLGDHGNAALSVVCRDWICLFTVTTELPVKQFLADDGSLLSTRHGRMGGEGMSQDELGEFHAYNFLQNGVCWKSGLA